MVRYMIHTYPKRLWYVQEYLIPSLLKQGIKEEQIVVYNDENGDGNLRSCINSFLLCDNYDKNDNTWHLQDDVIICSDFKERIEKLELNKRNQGLIICGFGSKMYDGDRKDKQGYVVREKMWFSFQCIRIPNKYAVECSKFIENEILTNPIYHKFTKGGRNDDWAFRKFLEIKYPDITALNLIPNLVDHIDYLIGNGSGGKRKDILCSQYFKEYSYLVEELTNSLINDGHEDYVNDYFDYKKKLEEERLLKIEKNKKKKRITYQDEDVYV